MTTAGETEPGGWRLDRRVPAVLLFMLALQIGTALVWAGAVELRLDKLEVGSDGQALLLERTARLEEKLQHTLLSLGRIESKLERIERRKHERAVP